eukprot:jgi/Ulvmu1/8574/UM045_0016.1
MQHEIEKYVGEGRYATARSLINAGLPQEQHPSWHAAIDILQYGPENPHRALSLHEVDGAMNEARVRKAFKLRSILVHPDKFSSSIAVPAFRQLSAACEVVLTQIMHGGASQVGTTSSAHLSEKYPWWEPWDDLKVWRGNSKRGLSCGCAEHASSAPQKTADAVTSNSKSQRVSPMGHGTGSPIQSFSDGRANRSSQRSDADHNSASVPYQQGNTAQVGHKHKRHRQDGSKTVDADGDASFLDSLSDTMLAQEVQRRQRYLIEALASKQQQQTNSSAEGERLAKATEPPREDIEHDTADAHDLHSGVIGSIAVEKLGLHELRAALERARACLAPRKRSKRSSVGTTAGGFF